MRSNKLNNIKKTQTQWSSRHQRDWFSSPLAFCSDLCSGRMSEEWVEMQLLSRGNPAHGWLYSAAQSTEQGKIQLCSFSLKAVTCLPWWRVLSGPSSYGLTCGGSCTNPVFGTPGSDSWEQHKPSVLGSHRLDEKNCILWGQHVIKDISSLSLTAEMQ